MIKDMLAVVDDGDRAQGFLKAVVEIAAAREAITRAGDPRLGQ